MLPPLQEGRRERERDATPLQEGRRERDATIRKDAQSGHVEGRYYPLQEGERDNLLHKIRKKEAACQVTLFLL